jgi:hypothetical protein
VTRKIAIVSPAEMSQASSGRRESSAPELPLSFPAPSNLRVLTREEEAPAAGPCPAELQAVLAASPLWELDIAEVTGHNLEARGREEVNRMLGEGWRLLHIYTLRYREREVWRERPMAILGRPRARDARPEAGGAAASKGVCDENSAGRG